MLALIRDNIPCDTKLKFREMIKQLFLLYMYSLKKVYIIHYILQ